MAKHNKTGTLGESIAETFLMKRGFVLIERNHWRKWGEIDLVMLSNEGVVHFIEVKATTSVYCDDIDAWRPEEMLHGKKLARLRRVIQTYILQHNVDEWVFDVIIVYINNRTRIAKCKYIKDIIL